MSIGMLFCIYGVKEAPREIPAAIEGKEKAKQEVELKEKKEVNLFLDFFNCKDLRQIFEVFTRKRSEKKRAMLFLCYVLLFFGFGPMFGERLMNFNLFLFINLMWNISRCLLRQLFILPPPIQLQ